MSLSAVAYQEVPPAPGRPEGPPGAQTQATEQATPSPGDGAPPAPGGGSLGLLFPLLIFVPLILLMLWSGKSQQKKQQKVLAELKKGDRVLLQSGIAGKLIEMGDRFAKIEIAPNARIEVLKSGILGKDSADTQATAEKK